jgi:GTP-binding protein
LNQYSQALAQKLQVVVLNKMDVKWAQDAAALFAEAYGETDLLQISAATGQGLQRLTAVLCNHLDRLDEIQSETEG